MWETSSTESIYKYFIFKPINGDLKYIEQMLKKYGLELDDSFGKGGDSIYVNLTDKEWGAIPPKSFWYTFLDDNNEAARVDKDSSIEWALNVIKSVLEKKDLVFKNNKFLKGGEEKPNNKLLFEIDEIGQFNSEGLTAAPEGKKESDGKLEYELDWEFISMMAERMAVNKSKYGKDNWKKPIDIDSLKQSLFRHVIEIMKDNYQDGEEDLGHITAASLNCMMLNYQLKNKK